MFPKGRPRNCEEDDIVCDVLLRRSFCMEAAEDDGRLEYDMLDRSGEAIGSPMLCCVRSNEETRANVDGMFA